MNIDIYSGIGILLPILCIIYVVIQRPVKSAWLLLAPLIIFTFIGAVSNAGFSPIDGRYSNGTNQRYLLGSLISIISIVGVSIVCHCSKK